MGKANYISVELHNGSIVDRLYSISCFNTSKISCVLWPTPCVISCRYKLHVFPVFCWLEPVGLLICLVIDTCCYWYPVLRNNCVCVCVCVRAVHKANVLVCFIGVNSSLFSLGLSLLGSRQCLSSDDCLDDKKENSSFAPCCIVCHLCTITCTCVVASLHS